MQYLRFSASSISRHASCEFNEEKLRLRLTLVEQNREFLNHEFSEVFMDALLVKHAACTLNPMQSSALSRGKRGVK